MDITAQALAEFSALRKLSSGTLAALAARANMTVRQKGETFYKQGDPPSGLFALQEGRAKLFRHSKSRVQILAVLIPGECFGAASLPDDSPCPCTAQAITITKAIHISPEALRLMFQTHPELMIVLLEMISERLKQFASLVHDLAFRDVAGRLAKLLIARATAEGVATPEGLLVERILSQQEMAAAVGTSREVIYRACKHFESQGLLKITRKELLIMDLPRLQEIAERESR